MSPFGAIVSLVGGALCYLGFQNKTLAEHGRSVAGRVAGGPGMAIDVEQTVTLNRPPHEVYSYWRNFRNLARFMKHIDSVEPLDDRRSRWHAHLFAATPRVSWDAELVEDIKDERISWRSLPNSEIETFGTVRFESISGGRATEVRLIVEYRVPVGVVAARIIRPGLAAMIREDLRRFKEVVESGEEARSAVVPDNGHAARPRYEQT
jgi:uncharacterized membrane protein